MSDSPVFNSPDGVKRFPRDAASPVADRQQRMGAHPLGMGVVNNPRLMSRRETRFTVLSEEER